MFDLGIVDFCENPNLWGYQIWQILDFAFFLDLIVHCLGVLEFREILLLTMLGEFFTNMVRAFNFYWYRFLFLTMLDVFLLTWLDTICLGYFEYVFY